MRKAHRKADKAMKTVRGHWFVEWAEAHGNPDFTDPIIERYQEEFEKRVAYLTSLEAAAFRAAETICQRRGRPKGSILSPDIIDRLVREYQLSTGMKLDKLTDERFVEFVGAFATAIGQGHKVNSLEVIKYAQRVKRKESAVASRPGTWITAGTGTTLRVVSKRRSCGLKRRVVERKALTVTSMRERAILMPSPSRNGLSNRSPTSSTGPSLVA